ncbi:hypothetical protein B296_00004101 [Ensete ventricosum]|uniref:Sugar phosphate transporter domain-containing protein n=1 Tax=Ensete ventricosum TaxID=4639 RepID=A0A426ZG47_ENSVE|nr:hypothetical protein B296_00004101 [Ensete ventricosum]
MSAKAALATGRFFTIGLVTAWYSSNIGVVLLNKYLPSNYGFKYPIFLTMCHMMACSLLSYVAIAWLMLVPMQAIRSHLQFLKIPALSLVFCGSVVSGNVSLRYLPVSFNQAVGATTPFFTAVFAYLMTLRRESLITYITLVPVVTGGIIASGVIIFLLPTTLIMEDNVVGITLALAKEDFKVIWYLLFYSALAYFVILTNFLVTKHTSALILQVRVRQEEPAVRLQAPEVLGVGQRLGLPISIVHLCKKASSGFSTDGRTDGRTATVSPLQLPPRPGGGGEGGR